MRRRGADKGGVSPLLACLTLLAVAAPPTRGEFQVNATTAGSQAYPAACVDRQGRGVIAWESRPGDADGTGVLMRRFDADDAPRGGEVLANRTQAGDQQAPAVSCTDAGDFLVVWESRGADGDDFDIAARRFAADGTALDDERLVHDGTAGRQRGATACHGAAGDFVVAWHSAAGGEDGYGVMARRFAADGTPRGGEMAMHQATADSHWHAALACAADGTALVAWQSEGGDGDGAGVFARRLDADGVATGGEVQVNAVAAGNQRHPAVAALPGGGWVVAWESSDGQDGDGSGIFARLLDAGGSPHGGEIGVNSVTAFDQEQPAVAATRDGFVVAWSGWSDGDAFGIFARRFGRDGVPDGAEQAVNVFTAGIQGALSDEPHPLTVAAGGDAVLVAWHSTSLRGVAPDGDGLGVFARGGALARGCAGDCDGDGAVTIAELISGVALALDDAPAATCPALDLDGDARITVAELIAAVAAALNGCDQERAAGDRWKGRM